MGNVYFYGLTDFQAIATGAAVLSVAEQEPIPFPNQPFDSVGTFATEKKQDVFLKGIQFELIFNSRCQTVNSTP